MTSSDPHSRRFLPSPAMCVALVALFVALGGSTYAVTALPRDSVGSAHLRDRSVTEDHLANRSVISRKLANGAVTNRKIARGTITASRLAPDTLGGGQVNEGLLGPVPLASEAERAKLAARALTVDHVGRAAEADHAEIATRAEHAGVAEALELGDPVQVPTTLAEDEEDIYFVSCGPGERVTGGGWLQGDDFTDLVVLRFSGPLDAATWAVGVVDVGADTGQPTPGAAYAICVKAP